LVEVVAPGAYRLRGPKYAVPGVPCPNVCLMIGGPQVPLQVCAWTIRVLHNNNSSNMYVFRKKQELQDKNDLIATSF